MSALRWAVSTALTAALAVGIFMLVSSAFAHEMTPEAEHKIEFCNQVAAGAGARINEIKMEFRWLNEENMQPIWKRVQEAGAWPKEAFYIRDDGESAAEKATLESNVMLGWAGQDKLIAEGKKPIDPQKIKMECLHRVFEQTDAGAIKRTASSEGLREESCRADAAEAMMLWRLEVEYGKSKDDAWRLMGQSYSEPLSDTKLTRWQSWVSDWRRNPNLPFLHYAHQRCMGSAH